MQIINNIHVYLYIFILKYIKINSDLEILTNQNTYTTFGELYIEISCNVLYIYGTINAELLPGWNIILDPVPLSFTMAGVHNIQFTVINNNSTNSSNQFLQAMIDRTTNRLMIYSWENISSILLLNTSIPIVALNN